MSFSEAVAKLLALYAEVDARNAINTKALDLPCHRGCDMCCHESVFITPLEFFCAWDWLQDHIDDASRCRMIDDGLSIYKTNQHLIEALDAPPPDGARDHFAIAKQLRFRCPLLGADGACQIYPVRELLARLFGCSFEDDSSIYGCILVQNHLAHKTVTLMKSRPTARRLHDLPLTHKRQVYPYYIHWLVSLLPDIT